MNRIRPHFDTSTPLFRVSLSLAAVWVVGFTAYGLATGAFNRIMVEHWSARDEAVCFRRGL